MKKELSLSQKKEWAQTLFIQNELSQKEIAAKVLVSEKTLSKWVNENNWDALRKSMLITKNEILRGYYDVLDKIRRKLKEEDSIGDTKLADMNVKYTAAIKNLETDTNIAQIMEVARMFINNLQIKDPLLALSVANEFDAFIKDRLKRF